MESQCRSQHTRPQTHVVVDPIGRTAAVAQARHMGAYPDPNISRHVEVSGEWIWLVLIDWRRPVDGDSAQHEAEQDRHIQPVTPANKEMMPPGREHNRLSRSPAR